MIQYSEAGRAEVLRKEAEEYVNDLHECCPPTGGEKALQVFLKPMKHKDQLPAYSNEAVYLSPNHCRLCLQGEQQNMPFDLATHLKTQHAMSMEQYRERVLQDALTYGLQAVPNQLLRSRLAQYEHSMLADCQWLDSFLRSSQFCLQHNVF